MIKINDKMFWDWKLNAKQNWVRQDSEEEKISDTCPYHADFNL